MIGKKLIVAFFVLVIAGFISTCKKDNIVECGDVKHVIEFRAISDNTINSVDGLTRSNVVTTQNVVANFSVWGFLEGKENPYVGDDYNRGVKIVKLRENNYWDYANPADLAYWPKKSLDFYAVTPLSSEEINEGNIINCKIKNKTQKITIIVPTLVDVQKDVMVAKITAQPIISVVPLKFKHLLSQIVFKAKTKKYLQVDINSLSICNVMSNGEVRMEAQTRAKKSNIIGGIAEWSVSDNANNRKDFEIKIPHDHITIGSNKKIDLNEKYITERGAGELLLIPQKLKKVDVVRKDNLFSGVENKDSYLKINCVISSRGNQQLYQGDLYVPFEAD